MISESNVISKKKSAYFKAARSISELSNHRCKIGCVVVSSHKIISSGHNSATNTHAFQARIDKKYFGCECAGYLHAETDALLPLIRNNVDLSKASIYIYRRMKNGGVGMARPCPRCMSIIKQAKIRDINYTTDDGFANEYIVDNKEF